MDPRPAEVVQVRVDTEETAFAHARPELLCQFPAKRIPRMLSEFDLAAGELPQPWESSPLGPALEQDVAAGAEDGEGHDPRDVHDAGKARTEDKGHGRRAHRTQRRPMAAAATAPERRKARSVWDVEEPVWKARNTSTKVSQAKAMRIVT